MAPTNTKGSGLYPENTPGLVCLPPISDDLQLIWTQAELTNELDDHPQLIHTFSYFPYPSMPEIALLCLRYGLQMEKVKAWFMVQRIRCGISWSSEEIEEARARLVYNQDKLHFKPLVALAKKSTVYKNVGKLPIPTPKSGTGQELSPSPPCPSSGDDEPEAKKLRLECIAQDRETSKATELTSKPVTPYPSVKIASTYKASTPDSNLSDGQQQDLRNQHEHAVADQMFGVDGTEMRSAVSCLPTEQELHGIMPFSPWYAENCKEWHSYGNNEHTGLTFKGEDSYTPVMRRQRKTKEQLTILKAFFLKCQWARREDYKKLEEITGLPRSEIIQWFGDTRYALKHGLLKWFRDSVQERPSWLDEPQHLINNNNNGRHGEPMCLQDASVGTIGPHLEVPESSTKNTVKTYHTNLVGQSLTSSVVQSPVVKVIESPSQCSEKNMEEADIILDDEKYIDAMGIVIPAHKVLNSKPLLANSPKPVAKSPPHHGPSTNIKKNYGVLEKYWCVHQQVRKEDIESLVTQSGLSQQQVLDWFYNKSEEPAEVEVCLDEDNVENPGEQDAGEDDYVIIED